MIKIYIIQCSSLACIDIVSLANKSLACIGYKKRLINLIKQIFNYPTIIDVKNKKHKRHKNNETNLLKEYK